MNKLEIKTVVVGDVQTNCYLLKNKETGEAVIVDPGDNPAVIQRAVGVMEAKPVAVLITHGHFDHIMAANELRKSYDIPIYAPEKERAVITDPVLNESKGWAGAYTVEADVWVKDRKELDLAGFPLIMLHTPGHTEGSSCYYFEEEKALFSGDTLFCESVGRTDLPTGNMGTIIRSIKKLLADLPEDVNVYPGHGGITTVGHEREYNPFT